MKQMLLAAMVAVAAMMTAYAQTNALSMSRQVILVVTPDWNAHTGMMFWFGRTNTASAWKAANSPYPVVVGRSGLGWGRGVIVNPVSNGPVKHEGDGKSAAGIFRLSSAFGRHPASQVKGLKMPYQELTGAIECVDDGASTHYNSIVDRGAVPKVDWKSSEKMLDVGAEYDLGVVVDHNVDPSQPGDGSCIFLHIWKGSDIGTSGCTAMTKERINKLVGWLDPAATPLLVELPLAEYLRLKTTWQLPNFVADKNK